MYVGEYISEYKLLYGFEGCNWLGSFQGLGYC